jgi:hypothetical protein
MKPSQELRDLAAWYREFAEKAGNPWIWDARLRTADKLEEEAARIENGSGDAPRKPEQTSAPRLAHHSWKPL